MKVEKVITEEEDRETKPLQKAVLPLNEFNIVQSDDPDDFELGNQSDSTISGPIGSWRKETEGIEEEKDDWKVHRTRKDRPRLNTGKKGYGIKGNGKDLQ